VTHPEESTHTSTTSSSYLSSLSRPETPVGVLESLSGTPSISFPLLGKDVGYLASLNTKVDTALSQAGGNAVHATTIAASTSVATPPFDYLSSLSRGKSVGLAPEQMIVGTDDCCYPQESSSSSAQYLSALTVMAGQSSVSALRDVGASSVSSAKTSVSPYGRTLQTVTESGYLEGLSGRHGSSTSVSSQTSAKIVESGDRTSYSPFGKMRKAVAPTGYLSNLAFGDSSAPPSTQPRNYAPFGKLPKAVASEAGYLSSLARRETEPSPAVGSSAPPTNYSPFGSKPKVVISTGYLSGLGSAPPTRDASAGGARTSYSPFGRKPQAVTEMGYFSTLAATSTQLSEWDAFAESIAVTRKSYSPFRRKPTVSPAVVGYLGSLSGVTRASREPPQLETDGSRLKIEPKPSRGVLKPIASYHPVSGALVEIKSKR
jgi:hypothetical protein